jgi:hypothetical protein
MQKLEIRKARTTRKPARQGSLNDRKAIITRKAKPIIYSWNICHVNNGTVLKVADFCFFCRGLAFCLKIRPLH